LQKAVPREDYRAETDTPRETLRCAAVLIPLFVSNGEWHLLLTRRTDEIENHKGQVAFPGGACDEGEVSAAETALREAEEEIGLQPQHVRVLGQLTPMGTISDFLVTPVVGVMQWPYVFRPANVEVARIFSMPLSWLADKANRREFTVSQRKQSVVFFLPYQGELLWGATARMTVELIQALENV